MNFDAVIIGAGPAGCAAGIKLAQKGFKTAILEKSPFPRHKVCGEFFSPGSAVLWKELGVFDKIKKLGPGEINEASLFFAGQKTIKKTFDESSGPAYTLSRYAFDRLMLEHAKESGCRVFYQTEALKIIESASHCEVRIQSQNGAGILKASSIVMAVGKNHRFQKNVPKTSAGKIGFKRHFQNAGVPKNLELYFFTGGYLGLTGIENSEVNLCGIIDPGTFKKHGSNFECLLQSVLKTHPPLRKRLENARTSTPWLSCVTQKGFRGQNTRKILCTGDCAYFLEPMIGQGMTVAMACGILAAETIISGKDGKNYEKKYRKILADKQKLLNLIDPLSAIAAKIPRISRAAAKLFLRPSTIKNILRTPGV